MPLLDRGAFLRPIAHRGLHGGVGGFVENTAPAFEAAIARGFGVECDLRPAVGGWPVVFHDAALGRLVDGARRLGEIGARELARLRYRDHDTPILSFRDLLDIVAGGAPILAEIKSDWAAPDAPFLREIAEAAQTYKGPLALMSFDPDVLAALRDLAPAIPRGVVSQDFQRADWWRGRIGEDRAARLTHLLESARAAPSFFAYDVRALPTPVTRFAREAIGVPLFAWTVRTTGERRIAAAWADAPIFEGYEPEAASNAAG